MAVRKFDIRKNWVGSEVASMKIAFSVIFGTAILAGNDTFLIKNITQDRKRFITHSKHMIF